RSARTCARSSPRCSRRVRAGSRGLPRSGLRSPALAARKACCDLTAVGWAKPPTRMPKVRSPEVEAVLPSLPGREELRDASVHGRHPRAMARAVAQLLDPLLEGVVERYGLLDGVGEVIAGELAGFRERGVERGGHHLLELRAGQTLRREREAVDLELERVARALGQVDAQDLGALGRGGQVDEEQLVEAAAAQKLGRQTLYVVCRRHDEHGLALLGQPGEEPAEHARRDGIAERGRKALLDLVDPEHGGGERSRDL